jgi:hypothetical protein
VITVGQHWIEIRRPRFIDWLLRIKTDLILDLYWVPSGLRVVVRDRGYPIKSIELSNEELSKGIQGAPSNAKEN